MARRWFILIVILLLQLYDRISSKVVSPTRAPPSDAVQRCREAIDALAILEHRQDIDIGDVEELRDILTRPHSRVGYFYQLIKLYLKVVSKCELKYSAPFLNFVDTAAICVWAVRLTLTYPNFPEPVRLFSVKRHKRSVGNCGHCTSALAAVYRTRDAAKGY